MPHPLLDQTQYLADKHSVELDELCVKHGLLRKDVLKAVLTGKEKNLPLEVLKEFYYLDACARIINRSNYIPLDKKFWELKHYVDNLVEGLYEWVENNQNFLSTAIALEATKEVPDYTPGEIYQTIALISIKSGDMSDGKPEGSDSP